MRQNLEDENEVEGSRDDDSTAAANSTSVGATTGATTKTSTAKIEISTPLRSTVTTGENRTETGSDVIGMEGPTTSGSASASQTSPTTTTLSKLLTTSRPLTFAPVT